MIVTKRGTKEEEEGKIVNEADDDGDKDDDRGCGTTIVEKHMSYYFFVNHMNE